MQMLFLRRGLVAVSTIAVVTILGGTTAARAGAITDVPEVAAEGYQLVYELAIPDVGNFRNTNHVPYAVDNSGSIGAYDRIAYYLELDDGGGSKWVYASMDAFQPDPAKIGLPHNVDNPVIHRQVVSNMNVFASAGAGVATGTGIQTGYIEMWPSNYSPPKGLLIPTGSSSVHDFNDSNMDIVAGYGSLQVHNYDLDGPGPGTAGETILAYNRWGTGGNSDLGIGNRPSNAPDWTFAQNAATFTVKNLQVLVRPAASTVVQTNSQNDTSATAFDSQISKFDLGNSSQKNFASITGTPDTSNTTTYKLANINNGSAANSGAYWNEDRLSAVVTYELDTSAKPLGYDITGIDSYAGHPTSINGRTQSNQGFELLVRKVGSDTFEHVGAYHNIPYDGSSSNNGSTKISLADSTGVIASGVDAVRFILVDHGFNYHAINAGTVYREIDIFGTPTGNLIQNGSFETPQLSGSTQSYYNTTTPFDTNWTVNGNITLVRDRWGDAADGAQWLSLESSDVGQPNNVGSVSQTFDTMTGHRYLLSFDYAALDPTAGRTWTLTYDVGGDPITRTIEGVAGVGQLTPWQTEVYEFFATGPTTTLTFLGQTQQGGYWGPAIDNVGVFFMVPEPSTLALLLLGTLGLAVCRRRLRAT